MSKQNSWLHRRSTLMLAALVLVGVGGALAAGGIDTALSGWIGREITIQSSTVNDQVPSGGKLTFVYDAGDDVVRVCTRSVAGQSAPWRSDFAQPCNVALTFTRGERYCTLEDVRAGNAEVLSACHRLRSKEVAINSPTTKGAVELHDVIVFLVQGANGKHVISILVDSPARVTGNGSAVGQD
jgi:hypothetical protein